MIRIREHVHGLDAGYAIAAGDKDIEVAAQGVRPAGDIDNTLRRGAQERGQKLRAAARAGRIHKYDVRPLAAGRHIFHILSRVAGSEPAVLDAIELGVDYRVLHRVAVQLDSERLPGLARGAQPDRPDTAVGVQHKLLSRQTRHFNGDGIEPLGLDGVYLIKRARRYAEAKPQQGILDIPVPKEHLFARTEHHGAKAVVDVQHDGRYLRVQLGQFL